MQPWQIDDLTQLTWLGQLARVGERALFVQAQVAPDDVTTYRWTLWQQVGTQAPTPLTSQGVERQFQAVDEETVCFTRPGAAQTTQLFKLNLTGGEAQVVATLPAAKLQVVAVRAKHAVLKGPRPAAEQQAAWHTVTEVPFWSNEAGWVNEQWQQLWLVDLATGQVTTPLPAEFNVTQVWPGPTGKLYLAGTPTAGVRPEQAGLYQLEVATGDLRKLLAPGQWRVDAVAELAGALYVVASDGHQYGINQNPAFYRLNATTHQLTLVAPWDHNVGNMVVTDCAVVPGNATLATEKGLYFVTTVVDHNELMVFDGHQVKPVFKWAGTILSFAFRQGKLLFLGAAPNQLPKLYQVVADRATCLADFNQAVTGQRQTQVANRLDYQDSTGRASHGWVLLPVNYQPTQTYPAVVVVHGGPRAAHGTVFFHEMQVLAAQGNFVFFTNLHGSEGQGDEYADLRGKYGQVDYADLMTFVDAALAAYPAADPARLGLTGGSYGGFMTNWALGQTTRFKAAVSMRGIATWTSMLISDIGPAFVTDQLGVAQLPADFEKYWQFSPLRNADRITTPTLFLHSDHDFRCPLPEGMQMFQALKLRGVDTKLVVFHGSNHDLSRTGAPDQRLHRLQESLAWFEQHL